MSVAYFKERLKNANEINAEREERREIEKIDRMEWDKSFASLERHLERDDTPRGPDNRHTHETRIRLSVEKIARTEAQHFGSDTLGTWASGPKDQRLFEAPPIPMWPGSSRTQDLRDNFIYLLFGKNLQHDGEIRTYSQFAIYFGMRAVVRLLAEVPHGEEMLAEVDSSIPTTSMRSDAIALYRHLEGCQDQMKIELKHDDNTHPLNVIDSPFELMSIMRDWVPGIEQAAESLLIAYSNAVRIERSFCDQANHRYHDGTLPDDPTDGIPMLRMIEMWPEPLRIEQACLAYMDGTNNYKVVATRYRLPHARFRKILVERNIVRSEGRPKEAA